MRRRWLWVLGGVMLLGVATVLGLALLIPPIAPFRFLEGRVPNSPRPTGESAHYTFHADYDDFVKTASTELEAVGAQRRDERSGDSRIEYMLPDGRFVAIWRDTRGDVVKRTNWGDHPGWILVQVDEERGSWDRIKAVFGL